MTVPSTRLLPQLAVLLLAVTAATGDLSFPPTLVKQPTREQLFRVPHSADEPDEPFLLECEATGDPEPTYQWTKNGEKFDPVSLGNRITQQPHRGSLVFTAPENTDEGLYQCHATNDLGTAVSGTVSVRKTELGKFPDNPPKHVRVREGDPLSLACDPPAGYPRPYVSWVIQHANGTLQALNSSRMIVDPQGDLHFSHVETQDAFPHAVYACVASSRSLLEYKLGNKILLNVESRPSSEQARSPTKQYVSPEEMVALQGRFLELHCVYGGTPEPQTSWKKRGGDLSPERVSYSNNGRTLKLHSVSLEDEDTYECEAGNGVGEVQTHAIHVKVEAEPIWLQVPNSAIKASGESATFNCCSSGLPEPKLHWFRNGVPIEMLEGNSNMRLGSDRCTLIIEHLTMLHTAVYQCNASNIHGYAFHNFFLNVIEVTPLILEPPEPLTVGVVTSKAILRCRVAEAARPELKWTKGSQELTGGRYHILDSGDLQIDGLTFADQGKYTCSASDRSRNHVRHTSGRLEVKFKTRITEPPQDYEVASGGAATFRCSAQADPSLELSVDWLFNDQPIDFEVGRRLAKLNDNSLTITRATKLDSGNYTCVARTGLDSDRATATLIVQDVPGPPRLVHVECHSRDVLLEWQPTGDGRAPILSYSIQYNTSFSPDVWEDSFKNVPASDTMFTLSMSPWVNYSFRVVARNKVGFSLPSEVSETCTTHEDVPYKNPDHVAGRGERPDNLVITWTPMHPVEHNAPGFHYKVLWKRDDNPYATWNSHLIDDWRQNRHVVTNQPTFKPYRIKVEAYNRLGQANTVATESIGYSGEDVPLAAPKEFRLVEIRDGRTAVFSWSPVSPESVRGHFRGYKIQTWTTDEGKDELKEIELSANVSTAMASLFRPFSRNVVQVLAYNSMYNGPPSDTVDFLTPEAVPGPVASFEGQPLGSRAAYLSWKPPLEPNGLIKGYRIYYEEIRGGMVGPKTERRPPVTGPQRLHAKLTGLKPRTKYRITIRAETYAGQGSPYFFELETPNESENLPDAADFTWTYLPGDDERAGVRVTWLPAMTKHLGRDFYVQYRHKGENTWQNTEVEEYEDTIVLEGLDKNAFYEVRIVVVDGKYQKYSQIEEVWTGTLDVPSPPEIVHVECEASSALLKWTPRGDNQASTISYSVQYSTSFNSTRGSWQDVAANIPASDTSVRMALSPWANYTFKVLASNKVGPSAPSEPSATTCATPENVPFKNPDSVTGRWNIYGDLIISWMSMAPIDHNAPGFFYRVSWKRNDLPNATWSSHDVKDWTQERLVLRGQSRSTPYSVRVEAHNSLGQANVLPREIGVPTSNKTNLAGMMDAVLAYFQSVFRMTT